MSSYNRSLLMGNLTKDPELKYLPNGTAVCNLNMAMNRKWNADGGKKEEVTYVRVVVWAQKAENASEYLSKGSKIFVEGRLQSRQWETDSGEKRSILEVVADNIQYLDKKKDNNRSSDIETSQHEMTGDIPF